MNRNNYDLGTLLRHSVIGTFGDDQPALWSRGGESFMAAPPGAVYVRFPPPRLACRDHDHGLAQSRLQPVYRLDQAGEGGNHADYGSFPVVRRPLNFGDGRKDEITSGFGEPAVHGIHQHQPSHLLGLPARIEQREHRAVGMGDQYRGLRHLQKTQRGPQVADLVIGPALGGPRLAASQSRAIVGDYSGPGLLGQHQGHRSPRSQIRASPGLEQDRDRHLAAVHDEVQLVTAYADRGIQRVLRDHGGRGGRWAGRCEKESREQCGGDGHE